MERLHLFRLQVHFSRSSAVAANPLQLAVKTGLKFEGRKLKKYSTSMAGGVISPSHGRAALVIGGIELALAILMVILAFLLVRKFNGNVFITPYWALPYVVPGILGIVVGLKKNHCGMIAFMVVNVILSVMNAISCFWLIIVCNVWSRNASFYKKCRYSSYSRQCHCSGMSFNTDVDSCHDDNFKTSFAIIVTIVALAFSYFIASLAASIVGCASVCCGQAANRHSQPGTVIIQQPVFVQDGFVQPQQGYAPSAPYDHQPPPSYSMYEQHPQP